MGESLVLIGNQTPAFCTSELHNRPFKQGEIYQQGELCFSLVLNAIYFVLTPFCQSQESDCINGVIRFKKIDFFFVSFH